MSQFYEVWKHVFVNRQPTAGEIRPLSMDEIEIDCKSSASSGRNSNGPFNRKSSVDNWRFTNF